MRVYSRSYWPVFFCTTNRSRVLARESWQTFENYRKNPQYFMNTLYLTSSLTSSFNNITFRMSHYRVLYAMHVGPLEMKLTYEPVCPSVVRMVCLSVWLSVGLSKFPSMLLSEHLLYYKRKRNK